MVTSLPVSYAASNNSWMVRNGLVMSTSWTEHEQLASAMWLAQHLQWAMIRLSTEFSSKTATVNVNKKNFISFLTGCKCQPNRGRTVRKKPKSLVELEKPAKLWSNHTIKESNVSPLQVSKLLLMRSSANYCQLFTWDTSVTTITLMSRGIR